MNQFWILVTKKVSAIDYEPILSISHEESN